MFFFEQESPTQVNVTLSLKTAAYNKGVFPITLSILFTRVKTQAKPRPAGASPLNRSVL